MADGVRAALANWASFRDVRLSIIARRVAILSSKFESASTNSLSPIRRNKLPGLAGFEQPLRDFQTETKDFPRDREECPSCGQCIWNLTVGYEKNDEPPLGETDVSISEEMLAQR
jgi:hypothetical protein